MQHPFLRNRNFFVGYLAFWVVVSVYGFAYLYYFKHFTIGYALADAIVYQTVFAFIGMGVWYPVFYISEYKTNIYNLLAFHCLSAGILLMIWFAAGYVAMMLLPGTEVTGTSELFPWRIGVGVFYYVILILIYYLVIYYDSYRENLVKESELRSLVKDAELQSLKMQINPHFLFNALNSINMLTLTQPDRASEMIIKLSEFLRYSISHKKDEKTTLESEIANAQKYLEIEKVRFGQRLETLIEICEPCYTDTLPNLILQPLLENAVKFGLHENTGLTTIEIVALRLDQFLEIRVRNNYAPDTVPRRGEGIGLSNIRQRIALIYGRNDLVKITDQNYMFEVTMFFPQG